MLFESAGDERGLVAELCGIGRNGVGDKGAVWRNDAVFLVVLAVVWTMIDEGESNLQPLWVEDRVDILGEQLAQCLRVDHGFWGLAGLVVSVGSHLMLLVV